jgi:hypothetical protein
MNSHPEHDQLLLYIDGELPSRKARRIELHLEACWDCRAEVEELQRTVADCVRYRKHALAELLPSPPIPWVDLYRQMERLDAATPPRSVALPWRWVVTTAAAALAIFGAYYHLRETPSVKAAALLQRAIAAAETHPAHARRIRVRTRSREYTQTAGIATASADSLFQLAHYDAADPLSAHAYQAWRDGLTDKSDEIAISDGVYRIHTVPGAGPVSSATLALRTTDLEPLEGRLEFRDSEFVEFSEVSEPPIPERVESGATHLEVPPRQAVPSRPAAAAPRTTAPPAGELQVLAALHRIGADLGDPLEVSQSDGRVNIKGIGVPPERQRQIEEALSGLPGVGVEFAAATGAVPAAPAGPSTAAVAAPEPGALQKRLERLVGGSAEMDRFSAKILDWDEAAMARAYALRRLAQQYPSDAAMSDADREILRGMAREHASALAVSAANLEQTLTPVLTGLGAADTHPAAAADTWQAAVEQVFLASRKVEVLSSLLLGVAAGDNPKEDLPSGLLNALRELRADLDQCQRLLRR